MSPEAVSVFLYGASAVAAATAGLFFLRFWRDTRDRFFAYFALAFWAFAFNSVGLALTRSLDEARTYFYLVRLVAFLLIIWAVVDKNRAPVSGPDGRAEEGRPGPRAGGRTPP
jgi:hypothetical protein